jgi:ATP adenylyltransferase
VAVERLWTPWRRAFVESAGAVGDAAPACFLCTLPAADPARDREHLLVHRGQRAYVLLNRYPYNSGHVMVAPYRHTGDFAGLDPDTANALTALAQQAVSALERAYRPEAFNVGLNLGRAAGAGLPDHLHVHVVPRWTGDTNFMPVVGNTKVLPETLEQTYDRLAPLFAGAR